MTWVFVVALALIETSHFAFPFVDTGHFGYFSGLYTCILPVAAGWILAFLLFRDGKRLYFTGPNAGCVISKSVDIASAMVNEAEEG